MIVWDRQAQRVWVLGARVHHGLVGVGLTVVGLGLMLHDRFDFPWLRDND